MGYRFNDNPPKPENNLPKYAVRNGATLDLNFECYYLDQEGCHDPNYHDHIGWPSPDNPDAICQMMPPHYPDPRIPGKPVLVNNKTEIHLEEEGYTQAIVVFDDIEEASGVIGTAEIDDYIVKVHFDTNYPAFEDKPIDLRFTVFVSSPDARNAVCHGMLSVLPGSPFGA